jgi:hypothetical protein
MACQWIFQTRICQEVRRRPRRWPRACSLPTKGSTKPNPELENLGAAALREAKKLKASYADIRIIRYRQQFLLPSG